MNIRNLLRSLVMLMTFLCVVSSAFAVGQKPNIVFIFTDDQRFDAIGAADPAVKTPKLDRLAACGTRYTNAFVTLSICSPSRAAVMTAQYGSVTGVTTLGRRIADTSPLLPKLLRDAGYHTGMFGKWHLGNHPAEIGFDEPNYFHANGSFFQDIISGTLRSSGHCARVTWLGFQLAQLEIPNPSFASATAAADKQIKRRYLTRPP